MLTAIALLIDHKYYTNWSDKVFGIVFIIDLVIFNALSTHFN